MQREYLYLGNYIFFLNIFSVFNWQCQQSAVHNNAWWCSSSDSIFLCSAPFYLAVNVVYGAEVSKELAPLWVLGPLIMALYIMLWRWLCALYVFSFKQTIKVVKNSPSYCMLAYSYVFCGKLKEDIETHILQPILSITNTDYKQLGRKKLKELSEWIVEKYLDFVESIWPFYCRTIRFLKRANLI